MTISERGSAHTSAHLYLHVGTVEESARATQSSFVLAADGQNPPLTAGRKINRQQGLPAARPTTAAAARLQLPSVLAALVPRTSRTHHSESGYGDSRRLARGLNPSQSTEGIGHLEVFQDNW